MNQEVNIEFCSAIIFLKSRVVRTIMPSLRPKSLRLKIENESERILEKLTRNNKKFDKIFGHCSIEEKCKKMLLSRKDNGNFSDN
ncbi:hypothetical protein BpHYR1_003316 [Brachionus plicatilis]|uniref:Uncharacterized protein n=1 Tax=Brachionus plicatilis TaxID=10195 RepID=A0A3M7Q297_BRAPC|nr:hypothetical protein BpHYR1_003316 [Brachionus plicatilis]